MKASKISALLAVAVLCATSAFAAANKASIEISKDVVVAGKTLPAGNYTVTWEGQGQNVDLSLAKGKEVVVKAPAHLLDLARASADDAVVTNDSPDGTCTLSQIRIHGKKFALELGQPTSQADVASRAK
jgi:hypothetical protein